eukprot:15448382-Alexandrium_andersonii.AAC.1
MIGAGLDDAASSVAPEEELFLGSVGVGANGDAASGTDGSAAGQKVGIATLSTKTCDTCGHGADV